MSNLRLIYHTGESVGSYEAQAISIYNKYLILFIITSAVQNNTLKSHDDVFLIAECMCLSVCLCICEKEKERRKERERETETQRETERE